MAESASAAVTFLLTDLESSTSLWEDHPEEMRRALAAHDRIIRGQIEGSGGTVFKGTGDGFWAAFQHPRAALDAAINIHDALQAVAWGALGALHVRIALHRGEAEQRDGDYFGQTMNRTARLLSETQAGDILVSETVAEIVTSGLPETISLASMGDLHLRDVREPLQVYRLVHSAGRTAAEPSRDAPNTAAASHATPGASQGSPAGLRAYTFGTFRVEVDDRIIDDQRWTRRKSRQLLKCLFTRSTRRLIKDEAFELFWPDSDPEAAAKTLRSTVHGLRQTLAGGRREDGVDWIVVDSDGVAIRDDAEVWVDADAFERLLRDARTAVSPHELLEAADRLYTGEYLPNDVYEDWAARRRESLRREWGELQLALARSREQRQNIDGAVTALERLVRADPCDERAVRELMSLLARNGRRSDALRAYRQLGVALRDELGVEPAAETRDVHRRIADGQLDGLPPAPAAPQPPPTPASAPAPAQDAVTAPPVVVPAALSDPPAAVSPRPFMPSYPFPVPTRLIGRQREQLTLERVIDPARSVRRVVLIGAAAGTGKSTLTGALVRQATDRGVLCLVGGSFDQQHGLPFGPVRDALADYLLDQPAHQLRDRLSDVAADLADIVPELRYHLGLPAPAPGHTIDAGRLYAAVHACLRALANDRPVFLCLEDLHAADDGTLTLLHYLARQPRRSPITILGTYRSDEVGRRHPLDRLVRALSRDRLVENIPLAPFGRDETASFVMSLLDGPTTDALSTSLYDVTEGNPLFLEQLTLALREAGRLDQRDGVWHRVGEDPSTVPPIIRDVIGQRFSRLSERCQEMLALAAIFGQTFQHRPLIVGLGGSEAHAVEDLDEAISTQFVYESVTGYRFGHAMVRESLYQSLSGPKRRRLHATAAAALEAVSGAAVEESAAALAHHYLLAGEEPSHREKAFRYSIAAGRHAAALSSHREALQSFSRACELGERSTEPQQVEAYLDAVQGRAFAERQLGLWQSCIANSRLILSLSKAPHSRALVRSTLVRALQALGNTDEANRECDLGLAELDQIGSDEPDMARARTHLAYNKSYLYYLAGKFDQTERLGRELLVIAERHGWAATWFLPHSSLGLAFLLQGRDVEAVQAFRAGISAAQHMHDRLNEAVFHENLGRQHYHAVRFDDAVFELERAVELYRGTATDLRAVNALRLLGRVALAKGNVQEATERAGYALDIAMEGRDRWASECSDVLGDIAILCAAWRDAAEHFGRALRIREPIGHADGIVESLVGLATVAELQGDWAEAERLAQRASTVAQAMDPCPDQVKPLRVLARLSLRRGQLDAAAGFLETALRRCESTRPTIEEGSTRLVVAELAVRRGDIAAAIEEIGAAISLGGAVEMLVEAHAMLAPLLHQGSSDQQDLARTHLERARQLAARTDAPRLVGLASLAAGLIAGRDGELPAAVRALEAARSSFEGAELPFDVAVTLREHARLLQEAGQHMQAEMLLATARSGFEKLGAEAGILAHI